jgi:hypothetical protein
MEGAGVVDECQHSGRDLPSAVLHNFSFCFSSFLKENIYINLVLICLKIRSLSVCIFFLGKFTFPHYVFFIFMLKLQFAIQVSVFFGNDQIGNLATITGQ